MGLNFAQLFFAAIAVLGMLYIEREKERNERHEKNKKNMQFNLTESIKSYSKIIANENIYSEGKPTAKEIHFRFQEGFKKPPEETQEAVAKSGGDMPKLREICKKLNIVFPSDKPQNLIAANDCADADNNHREDLVLQNKLLLRPYFLIFVYCMLVLWAPYWTRLIALPNLIKFLGISFVLVYSSLCVYFLVKYPVTPGRERALLKIAVI
jgi:hypothetical protein